MKSQLLRTNGPVPPGGFSFLDSLTGKQYSGTDIGFEQRVAQIINDRRANKRLITSDRQLDAEYISYLLSVYTCERLRANGQFCTSKDGKPNTTKKQYLNIPLTTPEGKACMHCGALRLKPIVCIPCGGKKLMGYRCENCGKETPK